MMNTNTYHRFTVGHFDCIIVADGENTYRDASLFFVDAPENDVQDALNRHNLPAKDLDFPYTCIAVETAQGWLLVDTGFGPDRTPSAGKLVQNLRNAGIEPTDIQVIVLSHGHSDHIGGLTDVEGRLIFPNARYVMGKAEWDFWTNEDNLITIGWEDTIPFMKSKLLPIEGRLILVEQAEQDVLPGIRVVQTPGHTPGHLMVVISSAGEELWCTGDALIHPIHLEHPDWYTAYDIEPDLALATKREILKQASEENAHIFAFHFPFPGLGKIVQKGSNWHWQPV
jgi:glyoxylase-like metal-dependent hydrolase (beta-lactamase superfamily II)